MLFLCYPKCSTCQKARKWLDEHGIKYTERHIAEKNPTYDELKEWFNKSGLPIKRFFNTSGLLYKEMTFFTPFYTFPYVFRIFPIQKNTIFHPVSQAV